MSKRNRERKQNVKQGLKIKASIDYAKEELNGINKKKLL